MAYAPLQNDVFLRAALRQPTPYTPVWLMRQAGRYLPEYKATRAKAGSFMGLAQSPDYATEVTLQPLERFPLDAAILFSDILTVPDAMGLGLSFGEGEGPRFAKTVRDEASLAEAQFDLNRLRYVIDAVASIRQALRGRVPLIGFGGSPWTLACYMVEGRGSDDYRQVKTLMYSRPDLMQGLLDKLVDATIQYLNAQIDAGAQAVMLFDSWGGVLSHDAYLRFALPASQRVLAGLKRTGADGQRVPHILFTKGGGLWLPEQVETGADMLGVDWTMDLGRARAITQDRVALQGNLDPMTLFAPPEVVQAEAIKLLDSFGRPKRADGSWGGHVFNLGHGINQHAPIECVSALVEAVHRHSKTLR
ncbi:uroporphyrinogen decarboxylase [Inhella gelatinilytica]|uniref:Uroporphyrinogen decarboxylase n=1 Tax=Inhella gelatinilytica TaxID=2795030 RepID=A0A931IT68_9BURK|nr:uroporphyrinogen decarboxylase [Inhella gelatinilytica]MBH9551679.1 uroporphyrinogen decarboxylase [Inhella gelatinilytica]